MFIQTPFSRKFFPKKCKSFSKENIFQLRERFLRNNKQSAWYNFLELRYNWMNNFLKNKTKIVEIGSAAGLSQFFLEKEIILTDVIDYPWINSCLDAENMSFDDASIDAIIAVDTIHHLPKPILFFQECERILKSGGVIIISDIFLSIYARIGLYLFDLEGWNFDVDIYDKNAIASREAEPFEGNNAVSRLLFDDKAKFLKYFPKFNIIYTSEKNCIAHLVSGGAMLNLNSFNISSNVFKFIECFDDFLTGYMPRIFAINKLVVIEKMS